MFMDGAVPTRRLAGGGTERHASPGVLPPDTIESVGAVQGFLAATLLGAACWLTVLWMLSRML
jgi:hypothetical protein